VSVLDPQVAVTAEPSPAHWYGVYTALVADVVDPHGQGRVKVTLPWVTDPAAGSFELWARLATLMAGPGRGTWFVPQAGDEVLVAFEGGNPSRPVVVGALWNGSDAPPESMDGAGANTIRSITTRNKVKVTLDDADGRERLVLETPAGQKVTLQDGPGSVTIEDANGNSVKLEPAGITVTASAKVTVNAGTVEVSTGMLTVNAGMSKFSGVVQCDTLIASSVVGASYTPGAGNIW
jgi:uncharacterized protein involved in type VI secretion and phage assembly